MILICCILDISLFLWLFFDTKDNLEDIPNPGMPNLDICVAPFLLFFVPAEVSYDDRRRNNCFSLTLSSFFLTKTVMVKCFYFIKFIPTVSVCINPAWRLGYHVKGPFVLKRKGKQ